MRVVSGYRAPGMWWFRVFGWGLHWKDVRQHRLLFSERNGFDLRRVVQMGPWRLRVLVGRRPGRRLPRSF